MSNTTAGSQADLSQSIGFIILKGTSDGMFTRTGRVSKPRPFSGYLACVTLKNIELSLKMEPKTFKNITQGGGGKVLFKSRYGEGGGNF